MLCFTIEVLSILLFQWTVIQSLGVCLQINCVVTKDSETHWFLNWDSVFLDWGSWFFTRWVPGLTIYYLLQNHCQRFDVIQAEPPFLLPTQEDKRKLCSRGAHIIVHQRNWETKATLGKDSSGHLMCHDLSDLKSLILIRTISKECTLSDRQEREGFFKTFISSWVPPGFLNDKKGTKRKLTRVSLRDNTQGFVSGFFQRKRKGKWDQENFLAVQFPVY